jgi:hypothetical protein
MPSFARKAIIIAIGLVSVGSLICWLYARGCAQEAEADFGALAHETQPLYAKRLAGMLDGGSIIYSGGGYRVVAVRRIVGFNDESHFGYLIGAELTWRMPLRMFYTDSHLYWSIEPQEIRK